MEAQGIVLTDPKPLARDARCPGCGAPPEDRVPSSGFGHPHPVCKRCGHAFKEDGRG